MVATLCIALLKLDGGPAIQREANVWNARNVWNDNNVWNDRNILLHVM